MSLKVLELNDRAIRVGDESGLLFQTCGFALAGEPQLVLGEQAEQQARLRPADSYSKFWQELNLDPISKGDSFRHHGDIAYAQLQHLAESAALDDAVMLAVPGSFSRQQLSILLGLIKHCPFRVAGVVDSALMAVAGKITRESRGCILYADLQLHQSIITRLRISNARLEAEPAVQIPGTGSQNLAEVMMQIATNMFIQQCRFNPRHDASSEQQLYNRLPGWLAEAWQDSNLVMELESGQQAHTARMPLDSLESALDGYFKMIRDQVAAMSGGDHTRLLLSPALAALPGFRSRLAGRPEHRVIEAEAVFTGCFAFREQIMGNDGQGLSVVRSLPLDAAAAGANAVSAESPTHVLVGHQALPLDSLRLHNRGARNGKATVADVPGLSGTPMPEQLGKIRGGGDGIFIDAGELAFRLNGESAIGQHRLVAGDRIQFEGSSEVLTMIKVLHVE